MGKKYLFVFTIFLVLTYLLTKECGNHTDGITAKRTSCQRLQGNVSNVSDLFKHPMSAIVSLGGCSAAFVSNQTALQIIIVSRVHIYNLIQMLKQIYSKLVSLLGQRC